jgi:D-sedoheptulose 7-phosphate isomerase
MERLSTIKRNIEDSILLKKQILNDNAIILAVEEMAFSIVGSLKKGGKVLFCGNGGSAADAQHLAAELSGRYYYDRPPLFAEALHVNTSYLTAVANDNSFEEIYSRLITAIGTSKDVLVGLSTSGNSMNVVNAIRAGNDKGMKTIALTGRDGGKLKGISNLTIRIPSLDTPRIQECHMLLGHAVCEIVEREMFPKKY